jgi:hypothetical protein
MGPKPYLPAEAGLCVPLWVSGGLIGTKIRSTCRGRPLCTSVGLGGVDWDQNPIYLQRPASVYICGSRGPDWDQNPIYLQRPAPGKHTQTDTNTQIHTNLCTKFVFFCFLSPNGKQAVAFSSNQNIANLCRIRAPWYIKICAGLGVPIPAKTTLVLVWSVVPGGLNGTKTLSTCRGRPLCTSGGLGGVDWDQNPIYLQRPASVYICGSRGG